MQKQPNILLIRHQQAAQRTAMELKNHGFDATLLPLSEIELLDNIYPAGNFDGVILTSPLAGKILGDTDFMAAQLKLSQQARSVLMALPCYCVGKFTANCAEQAGFSNITKIATDADTLAQTIISEAGGKNYLYPCAQQRSFDFTTHLASYDISCTEWEIYANRLIVPDTDKLAGALQNTQAVLLYSKRTTNQFFGIAREAFGAEFCRSHLTGHTFIAISPQVGALVPRILQSNTYIARDKNQNSMIECLEAIGR